MAPNPRPVRQISLTLVVAALLLAGCGSAGRTSTAPNLTIPNSPAAEHDSPAGGSGNV